ncbi:RNA-binding protein 25 isoform X1 [Salmo salar]|uniref:RNA-binding protein 25 isoform X1 n=1 Tax=Salmo salar TaxID=8030 RepID=A0A1S3T6R5_SALSA|nr:RNA-binding protein 25 isoform X1 [Salmo salar]XP_014072280.2 RNA-binding protein 25 isoform X1 [Salmo salar]XP_014072281.2 RNA-binding protein 25 isoform X1 [Salmo salar]XP_045543567.1 RNA-binding protein 25 isoform X1 [Salmo salar]
MNWDNQLSSILSAADGSVAKMRERLTTPGNYPKGREVDLYPVREVASVSNLELPRLPPLPESSISLLPPPSSAVQWADLAAVQSQLQIQSQAIESLTQSLHDMDREKHSQQRHIQALQDEVRRLREHVTERERERERERDGERRGSGMTSPEVERRMEQWRREVGRELSTLRRHITRATSQGNLEESFSSKLRREELDHLRREVDTLKTQLRRQEEDMFLQQSEARETRRQYEHSCKTLEELRDSYRNHSFDLAKTVSQYTHTEQEVCQIRITVSELKDEIRSLILRERHHTPTVTLHTAVPALAAFSRCKEVSGQKAEPDSDSEDFSPTPSLAEVSSDDLSWLDDRDTAPRLAVPRVRQSSHSAGNDLRGPGSGLDDDDLDDDDGNLELGSDSPPDLSLNDL